MWIYVIFPAKIWRWISFIFNSNVLMFLLWRCRVLVWKFLLRKWKEVVFFVVQVVLVLAFKLSSILINTLSDTNTAWKVSKYGVFLFCIFLYLERIQRFTEQICILSVNLRILSEYMKIWTRKTPYANFSRNVMI